jgi:PAT family beta-lactamase induction signal transducer AmpG
MLTGLIYGEPERHREPAQRRGFGEAVGAVYRPFTEFFQRQGAFLVLLFILLHKIGDTLGQLTLRLLLDDLSFTNDEIAIFDIGVGFWAYLIGIFVGGILYSKMGM